MNLTAMMKTWNVLNDRAAVFLLFEKPQLQCFPQMNVFGK